MKYTSEQLKDMIDLHGLWLNKDKNGVRAYFSGVDFRGADLRDVKLSFSDFRDCDFSGADLRRCDFRGAYLCRANFFGANFFGANLCAANLCGTNFRNANLCSANLRSASLHDADLRGVELDNCAGDRKYIKSLFVSGAYPITYTARNLQIGCENHAIEKWWDFSDSQILEMEGDKALKFWRKYKEFIKLAIEISPAAPTGFEDSK